MTTTVRSPQASPTRPRQRQRVFLAAGLLLTGLALVIFLSLTNGSVALTWPELVAAALRQGDTVNQTILWDLRLPRVLAALLVGAALGLAGALLQGMLRNGLASPFLLGISAGAGLMVVLVVGVGLLQIWVPLGAWLGAVVTTLLVYLLARTGTTLSVERLILGGVAFSSFFWRDSVADAADVTGWADSGGAELADWQPQRSRLDGGDASGTGYFGGVDRGMSASAAGESIESGGRPGYGIGHLTIAIALPDWGRRYPAGSGGGQHCGAGRFCRSDCASWGAVAGGHGLSAGAAVFRFGGGIGTVRGRPHGADGSGGVASRGSLRPCWERPYLFGCCIVVGRGEGFSHAVRNAKFSGGLWRSPHRRGGQPVAANGGMAESAGRKWVGQVYPAAAHEPHSQTTGRGGPAGWARHSPPLAYSGRAEISPAAPTANGARRIDGCTNW